MIVSWLFHDCCMSIRWVDFLMISWLLHDYFMIISWLFHDYCMIVAWLFHDYFLIIFLLFHDYFGISFQLFLDYFLIISWLFMIISWLFHDYVLIIPDYFLIISWLFPDYFLTRQTVTIVAHFWHILAPRTPFLMDAFSHMQVLAGSGLTKTSILEGCLEPYTVWQLRRVKCATVVTFGSWGVQSVSPSASFCRSPPPLLPSPVCPLHSPSGVVVV